MKETPLTREYTFEEKEADKVYIPVWYQLEYIKIMTDAAKYQHIQQIIKDLDYPIDTYAYSETLQTCESEIGDLVAILLENHLSMVQYKNEFIENLNIIKGTLGQKGDQIIEDLEEYTKLI